MFGKNFDELEPHDRQRVGGKVSTRTDSLHVLREVSLLMVDVVPAMVGPISRECTQKALASASTC